VSPAERTTHLTPNFFCLSYIFSKISGHPQLSPVRFSNNQGVKGSSLQQGREHEKLRPLQAAFPWRTGTVKRPNPHLPPRNKREDTSCVGSMQTRRVACGVLDALRLHADSKTPNLRPFPGTKFSTAC
jgi:hypothetical protein